MKPVNLPERWLLALMAIFLLHVIIFAMGGIAAAIEWVPIPEDVVLLLTIAMLMAQCGLAAIGLARSKAASYVKAIVIAALATGVWVVMTMVLPVAEIHQSVAASWLAALVTQAILTALGAYRLRALADRTHRLSHRFNILFLLLWTTVIAAILGFVRWLIQKLDWDANAWTWDYFVELQVVGFFSAVLAVVLLAAVSARRTWRQRALMATAGAVAVTLLATVSIVAFFHDPGATAIEIVWIYGSMALFLSATLTPLTAALEQPREPATTITPPQTPPPPDSDR